MDVTVGMWLEDIMEGNLFLHELYSDDNYPHWWLDKVFKTFKEKHPTKALIYLDDGTIIYRNKQYRK